MIFASIRHNLANLLRFTGRESRGLFWPYAIAVFLLAMAAGILLFVPVMAETITRIMDYARTHPQGFPQPAPGQPQALPPELMPDMSVIVVPMQAVHLVAVLLLAAAAVRRLHDRDRTGWWAALPLPFYIVAAAIGPAAAKAVSQAMMSAPPHQSPLMLAASLNSALSFLALIALVILLVGDGTRGPNRFGEAAAA